MLQMPSQSSITFLEHKIGIFTVTTLFKMNNSGAGGGTINTLGVLLNALVFFNLFAYAPKMSTRREPQTQRKLIIHLNLFI